MADESAESKALQFAADPQLATLYLGREYELPNQAYMNIYLNDQIVGQLKPWQFFTIKAAPGVHSLKVVTQVEATDDAPERKWIELETELEVSAGSVAIIECGDNSPNNWEDDERLLMSSDRCSAGLSSYPAVHGRIRACGRAWNGLKVVKRNWLGEPSYAREGLRNCKLTSDRDALKMHKMVMADVAVVAVPSDGAFESARQADTSAAYYGFMKEHSRSEHLEEARKLHAAAVVREEKQAWEQKIASTLNRDSRLPLTARKDKYMIALTDHLKKEAFDSSLFYFELLDRLNVTLSPSVTYFWGEALYKTGSPQAAIDKLYHYIEIAGSAGPYYRDALLLVNQIESSLPDSAASR